MTIPVRVIEFITRTPPLTGVPVDTKILLTGEIPPPPRELGAADIFRSPIVSVMVHPSPRTRSWIITQTPMALQPLSGLAPITQMTLDLCTPEMNGECTLKFVNLPIRSIVPIHANFRFFMRGIQSLARTQLSNQSCSTKKSTRAEVKKTILTPSSPQHLKRKQLMQWHPRPIPRLLSLFTHQPLLRSSRGQTALTIG